MADARQSHRIQEVQADREALEHIARMLEGRVLRAPGFAMSEEGEGLNRLKLEGVELLALLETMPAAIGILADGQLIHANAAFAYAFGYRSFNELAEAGGIDAIIPGGAPLLALAASGSDAVTVDALTRGRRRFKASFDLSQLDGEGEFKLVRLIDPAGLQAPPVEAAIPQNEKPVETTSIIAWDSATATRRLDFLANVSHEV